MPLKEEATQTLFNLGLTVLQAKVYIALARLGTSTGRATAKEAQVASQDVYRVLSELQEKGLAEKIISKPTMYKAIPLKEGLSILLKNKKEEYIKTEKQAKLISDSFFGNETADVFPENLRLTIISKITLVRKTNEKLADMTQKSIDIAVPIKMDEKMAFYDWPHIKRASKRGVKIRAITQKVNEKETGNPRAISKNTFFELRHLPETAIVFGMHLFDKQEVTLSMSGKPIPVLRTKNPAIVKISEAYFENMWSNAQPNILMQPQVIKQPISA